LIDYEEDEITKDFFGIDHGDGAWYFASKFCLKNLIEKDKSLHVVTWRLFCLYNYKEITLSYNFMSLLRSYRKQSITYTFPQLSIVIMQ